jgi:WD40 repeat protein
MLERIRIKTSVSDPISLLLSVALLSTMSCSAAVAQEATLRGLFGIDHVATQSFQFDDTSDIFSLAFTPDGKRLATSSPNSEEVHIWALQRAPRLVQVYDQGKSLGGSMNGLRFSSSGEFLASAHGPGQEDQIIRIWNTRTGAVAGDLADPNAGASPLLYASLVFSPDGKFLMRSQPGASYTKGSTEVAIDSFIVHDSATWKQLWTLNTAPVFVSSFGASRDGRYVVIAGEERLLRSGKPYLQPKMLIVDLAEKHVTRSADIFAEYFEVPFVAWSPDGRRFALGGRPVIAGARLKTAAIEIFDARTGQQLGEYTRDKASHVRGLMYSQDGKYLMIAWDEDVEIWDAAHDKLLQTIPGPGDINAASFSFDGRYLAVSAGRGAVSVWEMK